MDHNAYIEMAESETNHWWFRGRRAILRDIIGDLPLLKRPEILEIGSGTGGNLAMLSEFGHVTAIEMNATARSLSLIKAGATCEILAGYLPDHLPLSGEKFDLICLFDVLEHVEADELSLIAIKQYLKPDGYLVMTVPAHQKLWSRHDVALHHKRRYSKKELETKLLDAGFEVQKLSFMNMFLLPAAILARYKDKFFGSGDKVTGTKTPNWFINSFLETIFSSERLFLTDMNLPVGLSLLAVVQVSQ